MGQLPRMRTAEILFTDKNYLYKKVMITVQEAQYGLVINVFNFKRSDKGQYTHWHRSIENYHITEKHRNGNAPWYKTQFHSQVNTLVYKIVYIQISYKNKIKVKLENQQSWNLFFTSAVLLKEKWKLQWLASSHYHVIKNFSKHTLVQGISCLF